MLHTNVKHEPSTYTEAITERGAQCTRYGFAQKKRNLLQETAVGIIFTMGPKNPFWSRIFILFAFQISAGKDCRFWKYTRDKNVCLFMK